MTFLRAIKEFYLHSRPCCLFTLYASVVFAYWPCSPFPHLSQECAGICASGGSDVFAVSRGDLFTCLSEADSGGFLRGRGNGVCDSPCTGDASQTCGGHAAFDAYKIVPRGDDENADGIALDDSPATTDTATTSTTAGKTRECRGFTLTVLWLNLLVCMRGQRSVCTKLLARKARASRQLMHSVCVCIRGQRSSKRSVKSCQRLEHGETVPSRGAFLVPFLFFLELHVLSVGNLTFIALG